MMVTALSPVIGYDKAARIAHQRASTRTSRSGRPPSGQVSSEELFDRVVDPERLTRPGVAGAAETAKVSAE